MIVRHKVIKYTSKMQTPFLGANLPSNEESWKVIFKKFTMFQQDFLEKYLKKSKRITTIFKSKDFEKYS